MRLFYTDCFVLPLPAGHRFPMAKYARLRERAQTSGRLREARFEIPPAATDDELGLAHDPDYVRRVSAGELSEREVRRIGFPWSPGMVERSRRSTGATLAASRAALVEGLAVNLAGGTHHAGRAHGEGYCVFNDAAVTATVLRREGLVERVAVVDCDVHQGNGTAEILGEEPWAFTFSLHGAKNFPFRKARSHLDLALEDGAGDEVFLGAVEEGLRAAVDGFRPDLVIYLAGADPYAGDSLGRMCVTKEGLKARDRRVLERCRARDIPVAIAMAGGYAKDIDDIVDIHLATLEIAHELCALERAGRRAAS